MVESPWFYIGQVIFLALLLIFAGAMKAIGSKIGDKVSDKSIAVLVSILFSYLLTKVGYYGIIASVFAGVVFIKFALSAGMGLVIGPVLDRGKLGFDYLCGKLTVFIRRVRGEPETANNPPPPAS